MGREQRARLVRKETRAVVGDEIHRAEVQLLTRCGAVLFRRGFFGRLKWLLTGK